MSEYSSPVNFIDLKAQYKTIHEEIDIAIKKVLDHGAYIMGPEVHELEEQLRLFTGAKNAISCANGTDAITLALMAWNIGKGDAVYVPSFTYVASAEAPAQLGATPFFVDVDKNTFNIDPESIKQAIIDSKKMGLKPSTIIAVDLFGQPSDYEAITEIAKNEKIHLLIDGAQSFGASYDQKKVGCYGDITTTSFFPAKPLGCYGDGGCIFTENDELAAEINSIRLHGKGTEKYDNVRIGINSRLDTIQAAILIEKLKIFPNEIALRNKAAQNYSEVLRGDVEIPVISNRVSSVWAQYTIKSDLRDKLREKLTTKKIPSVVYYPKSLHQQSGYKTFPIVSSGLEISDSLPYQVLSLPMHPYMNDDFPKILKDALL